MLCISKKQFYSNSFRYATVTLCSWLIAEKGATTTIPPLPSDALTMDRRYSWVNSIKYQGHIFNNHRDQVLIQQQKTNIFSSIYWPLHVKTAGPSCLCALLYSEWLLSSVLAKLDCIFSLLNSFKVRLDDPLFCNHKLGEKCTSWCTEYTFQNEFSPLKKIFQ